MSGLIRALKTFHRDAQNGRVEPKVAEQAAVAIQLVEDLMRYLPPAQDLAAALANEYARVRDLHGPTRRAGKLRNSYSVIENVLTACHAHTLSTDLKSVITARNHLDTLAATVLPARTEVTWGDELSPSFHGASIQSARSGGGKAELNLRRVHPELDTNLPNGQWILEGGAWSGETAAGEPPSGVEVLLGDELPTDIADVLERTFRKMICASSGGVRVVHISQLRNVNTAGAVSAKTAGAGAG